MDIAPRPDSISTRFVINRAVLVADLLVEFLRREIDELRPRLPRVNLNEVLLYARQNLPRILNNKFNQFIDWILLLANKRPRILNGRDALLQTDLLQYKRIATYDTDTDDAISLGDSTVANSDRMRSSDLEQELAKIKENMSSVFESKIAEMQTTIKKQAEAQAEMQAKMSEMMEQFKAANIPSSVKKPVISSEPCIPKCPPPAPPLPAQMQTPKFGKDRTNLMESIRAAGGFSSSGLRSVDSNAAPKTTIISQTTSLKSNNENVSTSKAPLGYDYRNELAAQLQKRRQAIERNENLACVEVTREKKSSANPIVSSMLERIPVSSPGSSRLSTASTSFCTDQDEWD